MILHPARTRPVTRWKNGKGVTREIAIFPPRATIDNFAWRVSIAEVHEGGPFSNFPDTDRHLAVLDGTIVLGIGGAAAIPVVPQSGPVAFSGDIPCRADVPDGAATDLNVMTRRGHFSSQMKLAEEDGSIPIPGNACTTFLVALCDLTVRIGGTSIALKSFDAAQFDAPLPNDFRLLHRQPDRKGLYIISIFQCEPLYAATPSDFRQ